MSVERIKYDYVSGTAVNVGDIENEIANFINSNTDSSKIVKLQTALEGGKNLIRRRNEEDVVGDVNPKIKVSVFSGAKRFQSRGLSVAEIESNRKQKESDDRMARRRADRAKRIAEESGN